MMQLWALIVDSFRESRDRKIFWMMLVIELAVAAAMFCVGFEPGKISILFGVWDIKTDHFTALAGLRQDLIASIAVHLIMDILFGWIGLTLAIITTAGFLPSLLERGAIDVMLAKPMSRSVLFLGKYLGSMVFVLFHAVFFVTLTFFVIGFRWHAWLPGYLWTIPLLVLLFSYVYCVSAWVGVVYRSTVAAVLLSLGAWVFFAGIQSTADVFEIFPTWKENRLAYNALGVARWCIPKTQDITYLAAKWSGAGVSIELAGDVDDKDRPVMERAGRSELQRMNINPFYTIGTSLGFEVIVVILAMWRFARSDY